MNKQKKSSEMYPLVKSYLSYAGKKEDFCRKNNVAKSTLSYWITKYRKSQSKDTEHSGFVKLTPITNVSHSLSIVFPNGIHIYGPGIGSPDDFVSCIGKLYKETL